MTVNKVFGFLMISWAFVAYSVFVARKIKQGKSVDDLDSKELQMASMKASAFWSKMIIATVLICND